MGIHRTYPYPAYGGLAPVPGGQGEQRDDIANPIPSTGDRVGKGLKPYTVNIHRGLPKPYGLFLHMRHV